MREGHPNLTRVAKKMAMSPRTLQRQLKERGMDFKKLVADTRRRFALSYLGNRSHTLTEIAFLLGYSEVSAFNRAFKHWTGSTPLTYRDQAVPTVAPRESVEVC
jgi:AraC-like DNA-binding protein